MQTQDAFICDAIRTPIGRYGGALSTIRPDDLAATVIEALLLRNPALASKHIDDVFLGCANQAGEDNRNIARMAALLGGLSEATPGVTINRLCGSGMDAIGIGARAIKTGENHLVLAGGVESMSRAPFVVSKPSSAFSRNQTMEDTTIGWRFVNSSMASKFGVDSMPQTAENVAEEFNITREDQDAFAYESQRRANTAQKSGRFDCEITPITLRQKRGEPLVFSRDEHPRETSIEALSKLSPIVKPMGTITAGNASGVNDGAAGLIMASSSMAESLGLKPRAKILGCATAGVPPRVMGIGPAPASIKLMERLNLKISDFEIIELNEAFAAQALAVMRILGIADDAAEVNPNGGAIALGHPLGMSGARLVMTAVEEMHRTGAKRALCSMCIGVGQGIAIALERC